MHVTRRLFYCRCSVQGNNVGSLITQIHRTALCKEGGGRKTSTQTFYDMMHSAASSSISVHCSTSDALGESSNQISTQKENIPARRTSTPHNMSGTHTTLENKGCSYSELGGIYNISVFSRVAANLSFSRLASNSCSVLARLKHSVFAHSTIVRGRPSVSPQAIRTKYASRGVNT